MKFSIRPLLVYAFLPLGVGALTIGCPEEGPTESMEDSLEETQDSIEETGEDLEENFE